MQLEAVRLLQQRHGQAHLGRPALLDGLVVHEQPARLAGERHELLLAAAPRAVRGGHARHHRREHRITVDLAPRLVCGDERCERKIRDHIAGHEHKVGLDHAACLHLTQRIACGHALALRL